MERRQALNSLDQCDNPLIRQIKQILVSFDRDICLTIRLHPHLPLSNNPECTDNRHVVGTINWKQRRES